MRTFAKFSVYISNGEVGEFTIEQVINGFKTSINLQEVLSSLENYILSGAIDFDCELEDVEGYVEIIFEIKYERNPQVNSYDLVIDVQDHYYIPLI